MAKTAVKTCSIDVCTVGSAMTGTGPGRVHGHVQGQCRVGLDTVPGMARYSAEHGYNGPDYVITSIGSKLSFRLISALDESQL